MSSLSAGVTRWRIDAARRRAAARAWLSRHLPGESEHVFALTLAVGVICGLAAVAFHLAIRACEALLIERALQAPGESWMFWTIASPTLGGLVAGAALTWIVPGARGSGIPQVKMAYATEGGLVRLRDALGKFVIGAFQIGSGASLGREGPTVQICAGATSALARMTSLPLRNMRRLTPVGVAAGIAAAFNAPIAAVTFTIEEIVGALDHTVLSGVVVAAALAAVIERSVLGVHPVIEVAQPYGLDHAASLAIYALLGLAAALVSVVFTDGLLWLRARFRALNGFPRWAQPALGGLVTGVLAVVVLRTLGTTGVNGGGYQTLGLALAGKLGLTALLVLCGVKLIATTFSYSSGGAGGIFAPSLFIGAMLGGAFGYLDVRLFDHEAHQLGAFALVGMGAVFAGVIRAPITSVLIIFEMTGGYGLVLPLMLANMTAYGLARRWRPLPIYEALLEQDGVKLPRATSRAHPLDRLTVADAMTRAPRCLAPGLSLAEAAATLEGLGFARAPVLDGDARPLGTITLAELRRRAGEGEKKVADLLEPGHVIAADAPLVRAVVRMNDRGVRQLLAIDEAGHLCGLLAMSDVVRAHARAVPAGATSVAPGPMQRVGDLVTRTEAIPAATRICDLAWSLRERRCLVVEDAEGPQALLLEDLAELGHDEDLEKMLVAADVARRAPAIDEGADLAELVRVLAEARSNTAVVLAAGTRRPIGVLMPMNLAGALLDWLAAGRPAH